MSDFMNAVVNHGFGCHEIPHFTGRWDALHQADCSVFEVIWVKLDSLAATTAALAYLTDLSPTNASTSGICRIAVGLNDSGCNDSEASAIINSLARQVPTIIAHSQESFLKMQVHLRALCAALEGRTQRPLHISVAQGIFGPSGRVEVIDFQAEGKDRATQAFRKIERAWQRPMDRAKLVSVLLVVAGDDGELRVSDYQTLEHLLCECLSTGNDCTHDVCSAFVSGVAKTITVTAFLKFNPTVAQL